MDTAPYTKLPSAYRTRDYTRILTIADLADTEEIQPAHIAEAIQIRAWIAGIKLVNKGPTP